MSAPRPPVCRTVIVVSRSSNLTTCALTWIFGLSLFHWAIILSSPSFDGPSL